MKTIHIPNLRGALSGLSLLSVLPCAIALAQTCTPDAWLPQTCSNTPPTPADPCPSLTVPGYGPGVAIHTILYPIMPQCQPDLPCSGPYPGARVQVLDTNSRQPVADAVSNNQGNFIAGIPPGDYIVHIETNNLPLPCCQEVNVHIAQDQSIFALVEVRCDSGLR